VSAPTIRKRKQKHPHKARKATTDDKAPLDEVLLWLKADRKRTQVDAAERFGWRVGTLRKAIQRRRVRVPKHTPQVNEDVSKLVTELRTLPPSVSGLMRKAITRRIRHLAEAELGDAKDEARIVAVLIDRFGAAMTEIDDDLQAPRDSNVLQLLKRAHGQEEG